MGGHIRRRGERSWELRVEFGRDLITGKRQRRFHSFKGTKREAQAELTRLLASAAAGSYVDPSKTSVAEFLDQWLNDWASTNVSPKTFERYQQIVRLNVVPHIGMLPLQRLKPMGLNELYGKLLRQGGEGGRPLSPRSVGHVHRVLHRAFGHAVQWGITAQNAADNVSPPRVEATEIEILREEDTKGLLDKLRGRLAVHDRRARSGDWYATRRDACLALAGYSWRSGTDRAVIGANQGGWSAIQIA